MVYRPRFSRQQCTQKITRKSPSVNIPEEEAFEFMESVTGIMPFARVRPVAAGYLQVGEGRPSDEDTSTTQRVIILPCLHFHGSVNLSTNVINRALATIVTVSYTHLDVYKRQVFYIQH